MNSSKEGKYWSVPNSYRKMKAHNLNLKDETNLSWVVVGDLLEVPKFMNKRVINCAWSIYVIENDACWKPILALKTFAPTKNQSSQYNVGKMTMDGHGEWRWWSPIFSTAVKAAKWQWRGISLSLMQMIMNISNTTYINETKLVFLIFIFVVFVNVQPFVDLLVFSL